jgi:threonine synthase
MDISCTNCDCNYPFEGLPYKCPNCGGLFDFCNPFSYDPAKVDRTQPGIWRYGHAFGINHNFQPVSLGEGNTPLIWTEIYGRSVAFKCEDQNPTGSFKDRGSALLAAWLQLRGIRAAVEDSSGNAGASFAAYAARVGVKAQVFVPKTATGPKRRQIEAYGAELVPVSGERSKAAEAVKLEAERGKTYASHAYLPFNLPGYATVAYELFEQLGNKLPGAIILPAGQGGLLLGIERGFNALRIAMNLSMVLPLMIAVQARECAPLWEEFSNQNLAAGTLMENPTIAEGVRVLAPVRQKAVLKAIIESNGTICVAEENEILTSMTKLAGLGFYVEPTSAIVLSGLKQTLQDLPDPVVVILTGSGHKYEENRA